MKILIGGPARQDPRIFKEHLKSIDALELPGGVTLERFYIVNDCPIILPMLKNGEFKIINTGDQYLCDEKTHHWSVDNLQKMSRLRNEMLKECIRRDADAVLFVDTDLILQPDTVKWLLASGKDIIAEVFWTPDSYGGVWPNAWHYDQCTFEPQEVERWATPGVYMVGGTGACMLITRKVIDAKVHYGPIYCLKKLYGEDRYFAIRAICAGFELYLDTHAPARHLYRFSEYEEYMEETYGPHR